MLRPILFFGTLAGFGFLELCSTLDFVMQQHKPIGIDSALDKLQSRLQNRTRKERNSCT